MRETADPSWQINVDTSPAMLLALYLRDSAGLDGCGTPAISRAAPAVHRSDPRQLVHAAGGVTALRIEWETWWHQLVSNHSHVSASPPDFPEFDSLPALQLLAHAHYGAAMTWSGERRAEYVQLRQERVAAGRQLLFGGLVEERVLELGRDARGFTLKVVELPLSENRAWYVEPNKLIMSQGLHDDEPAFRSYVQPVVELLV